MHRDLGQRFFDSNIRDGLGEGEAVNRAISNALKQIILDQTESPDVFAFNLHNGITLYAEKVDKLDDLCRLRAPTAAEWCADGHHGRGFPGKK